MTSEDDTKGPNLPEGTDWSPDLRPSPRHPEPVEPPGTAEAHSGPPLPDLDAETRARLEQLIAQACEGGDQEGRDRTDDVLSRTEWLLRRADDVLRAASRPLSTLAAGVSWYRERREGED